MPIDLICLDADDTLWHNMRFFHATQDALVRMLEPFADAGIARSSLEACEIRNLKLYGYGAKAFTLSMIETALELGGDDVPASVIRQILEAKLLCAGREFVDFQHVADDVDVRFVGQRRRRAPRHCLLGFVEEEMQGRLTVLLHESRTLEDVVIAAQIVAMAELIGRLPATLVFDHMGRMPQPEGVRHPALDIVRRFLDTGRAWVKLSGPYLDTREGAPRWSAFIAAASSPTWDESARDSARMSRRPCATG
jgi:hypothetical protein